MAFLEKYPITEQYLPTPCARRRGYPLVPGVRFIVAHDTGNPNSTAAQNVRYFSSTPNPKQVSSAHLFVDDRQILECIPALTGPPEKAWHVLYSVNTDNQWYGYNANDAAIGVEYCYGTNIDADAAYGRYVWLLAYICERFDLNPATAIVGHFMLDPHRKTDPVTGLAHSRRSYEQLLRDVVIEYRACGGTKFATGTTAAPTITVASETANTAVVVKATDRSPAEGTSATSPASGSSTTSTASAVAEQGGTAIATVRLNVRQGKPNTRAPVARIAEVGDSLPYTAVVTDGEAINGRTDWCRDKDNNFFWRGGIRAE